MFGWFGVLVSDRIVEARELGLKAVLFDMDGLLIDSEPLWQEAEIEVFGVLGVRLTPELCRGTMGLRVDEVVRHWYALKPWKEFDEAGVVSRIVQRVEELIWDRGALLPGASEVLQSAAERGFAMGLASSSWRVLIEAVLGRFKLNQYFSVVRSGQDEEFGKPHPAIYLSTAKDLGVEPRDCLVFEDSLNGVIAAKAARMKCVAVPDASHAKDPRWALADWQKSSLTEVDTVFWAMVESS